jgi:PHD/YefM family antitoxin component YafN of YafNO toxin-antitoxin module
MLLMQIQTRGVTLKIEPKLLARMKKNGTPVVLKADGKAQFVVQDTESYRKLVDDLDETKALAGIRRGLADVQAGRVTPLEEFEKRVRSRYGIPRHPR